jgi:hypothetical protein
LDNAKVGAKKSPDKEKLVGGFAEGLGDSLRDFLRDF